MTEVDIVVVVAEVVVGRHCTDCAGLAGRGLLEAADMSMSGCIQLEAELVGAGSQRMML